MVVDKIQSYHQQFSSNPVYLLKYYQDDVYHVLKQDVDKNIKKALSQPECFTEFTTRYSLTFMKDQQRYIILSEFIFISQDDGNLKLLSSANKWIDELKIKVTSHQCIYEYQGNEYIFAYRNNGNYKTALTIVSQIPTAPITSSSRLLTGLENYQVHNLIDDRALKLLSSFKLPSNLPQPECFTESSTKVMVTFDSSPPLVNLADRLHQAQQLLHKVQTILNELDSELNE